MDIIIMASGILSAVLLLGQMFNAINVRSNAYEMDSSNLVRPKGINVSRFVALDSAADEFRRYELLESNIYYADLNGE